LELFGNNPVNFIDPFGLEKTTKQKWKENLLTIGEAAVIFGGVGIAVGGQTGSVPILLGGFGSVFAGGIIYGAGLLL
jgi:hypothetical protein